MLSPADEALVGRDPTLPGLRILLDPEAVTSTLRDLYPGGDVTGAEPRYVRYKPGTSCLVGYRVHAGGHVVHLYARAHDPAIHAKLGKAEQRQGVPSALGGGIAVDAAQAIVVYPFPNDHELASIAALGDDASRRRLLADALPDEWDVESGRLEVLRYKPERRLVARFRGAGASAVLRFYTDADYERIGENVDRFESRDTLRVPGRLGRAKRSRVAAYEWIEGTSLRERLVEGPPPASTAGAVGVAVAALHAQRSSRLAAVTSAEAYAASIVEAARVVRIASPDSADRAARVGERLAARFATRRWRMRRAVHGDLSADQIVLAGDTVAVVDFDRAGLGDPRMDLGVFLARLEYDALIGAIAPAAVEATMEPLLDGYRAGGEKDVTRRVPRFAAAELLRLAVEPFRTREAQWPELTDAVVARAEVLGGVKDA